MRVAILFNDDRGLRHGEALDAVAVTAVLDAVDAVETACRELGWEPRRVAFADRSRVGSDLVVFNLVEGSEEPAAARFLEARGVPFTGSPSSALAVSLDKGQARAALAAAGVPIPRGCVLEAGEEPLEGLCFPAIVKPAREDASHGISAESIVEDAPAAYARARYLRERYRQPAVVEEFVSGPELGVSLLGDGPGVLPMSEIAFSDGLRLLTYAAKWLPESADYRSSTAVPRPEHAAVAAVARAAWAAIGLRDYGRVDIRLTAAGEPRVIDVNPNPDLTPDAGFALAAARAGIAYTELIGRIVEGALARGRAPAAASA